MGLGMIGNMKLPTRGAHKKKKQGSECGSARDGFPLKKKERKSEIRRAGCGCAEPCVKDGDPRAPGDQEVYAVSE